LLTAQRRDELAEAKRNEFDLDKALWTLPRERSKNDKEHFVHLSPLAVDILLGLPQFGDGRLLFTTNGAMPVSGFGRARARLAAAMLEETGASAPAIEPFTLHDLRRTAATGMAGLGIAHEVVDRILNHTEEKISGVARIYNRFAYLDERKAALEVVGPPCRKPVPAATAERDCVAVLRHCAKFPQVRAIPLNGATHKPLAKGQTFFTLRCNRKGALLIFSAARRGHRGAGRTSVERQAGMGKRPSIARSPPLKSGAGPQGCAPRCAHPCGSMGCAQWSDA
jgi:hypothetical protein